MLILYLISLLVSGIIFIGIGLVGYIKDKTSYLSVYSFLIGIVLAITTIYLYFNLN